MSSLHPLLQEGQRHQDAGRLAEAEACYRHVLQTIPAEPSALYLMGTLELRRGRADEAVRLMRSAIEKNPHQPRFCIHLGSILVQQLKLEEAYELVRSALERMPLVADLHDAFGALLEMKGFATESFHSYRKAAELNPRLLRPHLNLAVHYIRKGQQQEAIHECQLALQLSPKSVEAYLYLAAALVNVGRRQEAIARLLTARSLEPQNIKVVAELAQAYLHAGDLASALAAARQGLSLKKDSSALLTLQYHTLWELGMEEEARSLLNLHRLIFVTTLAPPPEYPTLAAFHAAARAELQRHPTLTWEPTGKTTRKGYQSGALHQISLPVTDLLLRHLRQHVDAFRAGLPDVPHQPFFANKPADCTLYAWATLLESGGHQDPHFHPSGWVSGVYYLEVPPEISAASEAGWIEFGRPPAALPFRRQAPVRTIQPEPGKVVLFPSWTYHRTLPFCGTGTRISIAFDVMPR